MLHLLNDPFVKIFLLLFFEFLLQLVLLFFDFTLCLAISLYSVMILILILGGDGINKSADQNDNEASGHQLLLHCQTPKILLNQIINHLSKKICITISSIFFLQFHSIISIDKISHNFIKLFILNLCNKFQKQYII